MKNVVVGTGSLGSILYQNLMIQREVVEGDWQGTMREEERALMILLGGIPHKVRLCLFFVNLQLDSYLLQSLQWYFYHYIECNCISSSILYIEICFLLFQKLNEDV